MKKYGMSSMAILFISGFFALTAVQGTLGFFAIFSLLTGG